MSAAFETLNAAALPLELTPLRSDGVNQVNCLDAFGNSVPVCAHSVESIDATQQSIEARQRVAAASPLLQPCMCSLTPGLICMTCARWHRHCRVVTQRLAQWRAKT